MKIEQSLDTIGKSVMDQARILSKMDGREGPAVSKLGTNSNSVEQISLASLSDKLDNIEAKLSRRNHGRGRRRSHR